MMHLETTLDHLISFLAPLYLLLCPFLPQAIEMGCILYQNVVDTKKKLFIRATPEDPWTFFLDPLNLLKGLPSVINYFLLNQTLSIWLQTQFIQPNPELVPLQAEFLT